MLFLEEVVLLVDYGVIDDEEDDNDILNSIKLVNARNLRGWETLRIMGNTAYWTIIALDANYSWMLAGNEPVISQCFVSIDSYQQQW